MGFTIDNLLYVVEDDISKVMFSNENYLNATNLCEEKGNAVKSALPKEAHSLIVHLDDAFSERENEKARIYFNMGMQCGSQLAAILSPTLPQKRVEATTEQVPEYLAGAFQNIRDNVDAELNSNNDSYRQAKWLYLQTLKLIKGKVSDVVFDQLETCLYDIEYSLNETILMKGIQIGAKMERALHG